MFAVLVNQVLGVVDIKYYDENNCADSPMYGRGDAWSWVKTFSNMQEAEDYSGCLSFDCTVMRAVGRTPSESKNYKIVDGDINENQTDEEGTVWFPKMTCSSWDEARKFINSSCQWCRYNNIGIDDSDEKNQEVDIKLPGDDEINEYSDESSDEDLFGAETLRKLEIAREQRGQ